MTAKRKPIRTNDADQSVNKISDPRAGLERMKDALRQILKVPKSPKESDDAAKTR